MHCLFREATGFARAHLEENCELRGTDNVQGQISQHISRQMEAIVFIILQIFFATCAVLKIMESLTLFTEVEVASGGYLPSREAAR